MVKMFSNDSSSRHVRILLVLPPNLPPFTGGGAKKDSFLLNRYLQFYCFSHPIEAFSSFSARTPALKKIRRCVEDVSEQTQYLFLLFFRNHVWFLLTSLNGQVKTYMGNCVSLHTSLVQYGFL